MNHLTSTGQPPGGSSSVHIYIQTIHITAQKYIEKHKKEHRTPQKLTRMRPLPRLCGFYPGICLTTEGKVRKNLNQGSHT